MIVVEVKLHSAITGKVTTLGTMTIANDGTGTTSRGNYDVKVIKKSRKHPVGLSASVGSSDVFRTAKVKNYARNSRPIWDLVALALKDLNYG